MEGERLSEWRKREGGGRELGWRERGVEWREGEVGVVGESSGGE